MTIRTALFPLEATPEMVEAAIEGLYPGGTKASLAAAIAASPRAGRVGLDVLEMAAWAIYRKVHEGGLMPAVSWSFLSAEIKATFLGYARAAFEAAGLAVEEAAS